MNWKFWKKTPPVEGNLLTLLPAQQALIDALDTKLTEGSKSVPSVPYTVEPLRVPMHLHGLPAEKLVKLLEVKQRPYMPRSIALFTMPTGDWLVLIGWRDPSGMSSDLERELFSRVLVQTNAMRS